MKIPVIFSALLFFLGCNPNDAESEKLPSSVKRFSVDGYTVDIYTPPNYSESEEYSVIYINDGQSVFGNGYEKLALNELLDNLITQNAIKPILAVAIHSGSDRNSQYIPYMDNWVYSNWGKYSPNADDFTDDIISSIIPFVEKNYKAKSDRNSRALFGFSLGGLHAIWAGINYQDYFSMAAGSSPSLWVADYQIYSEVSKVTKPMKIWFDIGTAEWNWYTPFQETLLQHGFKNGESVFYYEVFGGNHSVLSWKYKIKYPIMVFAGTQSSKIKKWTIKLEVITSNSTPGVFYQRLNTLAETETGLLYSLASAATYQLQNPTDGQIKSDGRFKFSSTQDLKVRITYPDLDTLFTISYNEVQNLK